jgi:Cu(I)/Ag(I) efflux system membrane fusion protein
VKQKVTLVLVLLVGLLLGALLNNYYNTGEQSQSQQSATAADEPLYWVAPMDANYRRDKPGKSPMGMDLVPVYAQAAGTVEISPEVVNNLGVRTAPVAPGTLRTRISTVGYVQYDEDRLVHVHPRVEGWIEKLYVKAAGDPVEQGEPLYELY